MFELVAERFMRRPTEQFSTPWQIRGSFLESEAGRYYAFIRDCEPETVGFITNDAGTVGCSPDRLVGDDALLEIKCPAPHTQIGYLLNQGPSAKYKPQIQGQLWLCGKRDWCDLLSYHPELPVALVRVERDDKFIAILSDAVERFSDELALKFDALVSKVGPPDECKEAAPSFAHAL